jgi:DNA-binding XRE family transcriptional regulator
MITNQIAHWRSTLNDGKGISQASLARKLGVGRSYVKKLERGTRLPSWELAFELVRVLQQPMGAIFQKVDGAPAEAKFNCANTIPNSQFSVFTPAPAKLSCNSSAPLSARPAGQAVTKDKSLVGPAAKAVASSVALKAKGKK